MDKIKKISETEFQNVCGEFVEKEVFCSFTMEATYILNQDDSNAPFERADVENYYYWACPKCGGEMNEIDTADIDPDDETKSHNFICQNCEHKQDEEPEQQTQDIYEWWAVTSWLAEKLRDRGHPVIINQYGVSYWGRCTTGQAIKLDGVIKSIVTEYRQVKSNGKF